MKLLEVDKIELVKMDMIDPPGEVQRNFIDPEKLLELAESIREKGLIQPILLRPVNSRYEVVAGHRRFLAHQFLKLEGINAIVKEMSDIETVAYRSVENLQRENLSPLEEARSYNLLREVGGMTIEEICKTTGKSHATVKRYLKFYRMPAEFKEAVDKGGVCLGVAEKLIDVDDAFLRGEYLRMAVQNGITVMVAEMWVSDYLKSRAGKRFEGLGEVSEAELSSEPQRVYVTCRCCSDPVDLNKAKQLIVCEKCRQLIAKMKSSSS